MQLVPLAIAGVLSKLGTSYLQQSSLYLDNQRPWSEWVAWGGLALACQLRKHYQSDSKEHDGDQEAQKMPLWSRPCLNYSVVFLATLLLAAEWIAYKTANEWLQWSIPLITLSTFMFASLTRKGDQVPNLSDSKSLPAWQNTMSSSLGRRPTWNISSVVFVGTCIASSVALAPTTQGTEAMHVMTGLAYVCLMTTVYHCVQRQIPRDLDAISKGSPTMLIIVLRPLSTSAFAICTLYLAMFSPPISGPFSIIFISGFLRAIQLVAIISLSLEGAGITASTLATTSIAMLDATQATAHATIAIYSLVAVAALVHAASTLPKATNRSWLFILLIIPFSSFFNISFKLPPQLSQGLKSSTANIGHIHPVEQLFNDARDQFSQMLANQSQTLSEAVTEYEQRYGRAPPPNFDKWFEVAQSKDFLFIDEFDTIMRSLEPYWGISPQTLRARLRSIENAPHLVEFEIHDNKVDVSTEHYHAAYLSEWLNFDTWANAIPDTKFMISTLDEPRVVAPYDTLDLAVQNAKQHRNFGAPATHAVVNDHATDIKWINVGRQDAWETMLSSCSINSSARNEITREGFSRQQPPLPFVANVTASRDVCASSDLLHHHGFFNAPESLTITHSLVPVFSQCKPSIFNDVLYPSPYYEMQMTSGDYDESEDPDWDQKLDRLYWAGTATGGFSNAQNWMQMHRQRITMMTAPDSTMLATLFQRDHNGFWEPFQSTWSSIADMFHLRITSVAQCSDEACGAMNARFKPEGIEPKSAALGSKYALDIDGNTFSGRYYRLLKSKVCVLKHTSFNEWHDDRLIPWVHYVPLSAGAEELGEIMRYLTQEEDGQRIGKTIADQGMHWARKTLRKEDLEIVFVRVLMEYARIMNDRRDQLKFELES